MDDKIQGTTSKDVDVNKEYRFNKRSGTSGLDGQLYETKLLSLILLRAKSYNIDFILGTNMQDVGALDDIILRYKRDDSKKSKIIFLQAKHRNDLSKERLTVEDVLKQGGDFSLQKYIESYLNIIQKFLTDYNNPMFKGPVRDIEFEFIIYTPIAEKFAKKKNVQNSEKLLKTSEEGKVFQFKYDDQHIQGLITNFSKSRVIQLAKSVAKIILTDNFRSVMKNDIIKQYHVYLAQNVIMLENSDTTEKPGDSSTKVKENCHCIGKFRQSFLTSSDANLLLMKIVLCEELTRNSPVSKQNEEDKILEPLSFKLPIDFGNCGFCFYGSDTKQKRRLDYLCSIFRKLLSKPSYKDLKYTYVNLDHYSIGPDEVIKIKDLENYRLAGLVGNLLINDIDTGLLMFNLNEESLSNDNIHILQDLKEYTLSSFRFDINVYGFPRLTLNPTEHDRILVRNFLNCLKFHTNQSKEDMVEVLLKQEIDRLRKSNQEQHEFIFQVKTDAIYLKVHENVQNWWKESPTAAYLTKTCKFYEEAEREILDSPLMNIINFIYRTKIINIFITFDIEVINSLRLNWFLESDEKCLITISDEIDLTSIKVMQYFNDHKKDCIFIDLDSMFLINTQQQQQTLDTLKDELKIAKKSVIVIVSQEQTCSTMLLGKIKQFIEVFNGKTIIIVPTSLHNDLSKVYLDKIIQKDIRHKFSHLSSTSRSIIQEERKVIFQGIEVTVNTVFNEVLLDHLSFQLLRKLISNEKIEIGQSLTKGVYRKTIDYFISRSLCRYITLNTKKYKDEFQYLKDGLEAKTLQQRKDIVITTDSENVFEETCNSNKGTNVHWFLKKNKHADIIWKKSYCSMQNIINYVDKGSHRDFMFVVQTLKDVQEKVVIVSASPGMGKTTLFSQLAINTKRLHPSLWILQINLLDNIHQLAKWQDCKTNINLMEAMSFLYSSTTVMKDLEDKDIFMMHLSKLISINGNKIYLTENEETYLPDVDLSEIKLLNDFYNNNSLAVLFDGFDEVCPDYSNEVIQLLCVLNTSMVVHLWVSSRPYNSLIQLEFALGTFSFSLNSLTVYEQKLLFQKLGLHRFNPVPLFTNFEDYTYSLILSALDDRKGVFTGLPLHLYMLVEVYQYFYKDNYLSKEKVSKKEYSKNLAKTLNLISLYEKFTNYKFFDIRFGDKMPSMNFLIPNLKRMRDKEHAIFIDSHKKLATYLLLDQNVMLSENEIKNVQQYIEIMRLGNETTGIMECIVGDKPKFVHYTFAEYFAVEHIFDKLKCDNCSISIWQYFLEHVLSDHRNGIQSFINSKMREDHGILKTLNGTHTRKIIEGLLSQFLLAINALQIAIEGNFEYIAVFLLECLKIVVNQENVTEFIKLLNRNDKKPIFWSAMKSQQQLIVKSIIELITDVDNKKIKGLFYCQNSSKCNVLLLALKNGQLCNITLDALKHDHELMVELFTLKFKDDIEITAAHFLGSYNYPIKYCQSYLSKLNFEQLEKMFSVKDLVGRLPLHYAVQTDNFNFMDSMALFLSKPALIKMWLSIDDEGFSPIRFFVDLLGEGYFEDYHGEKCLSDLQIKDIFKIIYEEHDISLEDISAFSHSEIQ